MVCVSRFVAAGCLACSPAFLLAAAATFVAVPHAPAFAQEAAGTEAADSNEGSGRRGRRRGSRKPATPPGMQQAAPLVTFGDWNVFTHGQGRSKVCYAIAQPQSRTPKTLARDTGFLFVTVRKGDSNPNEIAVSFGFKPKPSVGQTKPGAAPAAGDPYLAIGSTRFGLVVKDENAWVQNQAEETRIVTEMSRGQAATVRTTSSRGSATSDDYALGGFAEAMKRTREECK